jgi:hypothetical protein
MKKHNGDCVKNVNRVLKLVEDRKKQNAAFQKKNEEIYNGKM